MPVLKEDMMTIKKAQYNIPKENGVGYEPVHLETHVDAVVETATKAFIPKVDSAYIASNKANILLKKDIVNTTTSTVATAPVSAAALKEVADATRGMKFVVSATQPAPIPGVTIIWIEG